MIKISVIVPVYKSDKYISRFIDSVLNQTLKEIELIIVDDKSIDGSMRIVENYANNDSRVKIIYSEKNEGPMIARQKGVKIAKGDYISFSDSDDELPFNALELLYNKAIADNSDIVAGNARYIKHDGYEIWTCRLSYGNDYKGVIKSLLTYEYRHNLWGKLFKSDLFKTNEYYLIPGMKYFEDYLLMYQLVDNSTRFSVIEDVVYLYYQNEGSSTQSKMSLSRLEDSYKAYSFVCKKLAENPDFEKMAKSYVQSSIKDQLLCGLNKREVINEMIDKYSFRNWLSFREIIKSNSLGHAIKLLIVFSPFWCLINGLKQG